MSSVQRSIFFSAVERYASVALFVLTTAVMSRLLTPAEFGTYAVISALTTVIAASFQEFGGANYLIQKHELSRSNIRTAFTITFAISGVVAAILFSCSGVISRFFNENSLADGLAVSAASFLFLPFSGTVAALFRREMNFGKLAICNLAANTAGAIVSIALALMNFSYMAPIWGGLATCIMLTIVMLAWHRDFYVFRPSLIGYRDIVGFGCYSSGVSLINVFYNLAPQLFLARVLDFASVGLYSRATSLTQTFDRLVTQVLAPVIMPAIAAQRKAGADLRRVYLDAIEQLSAVQWPFLIFIAIMAQPIILIWLGPNWLEVVSLVRILCIANLALFAACLSYPMFVALGRVRDALVSSLISLPPSLLIVLCAAFFGVQAVALAALVTLPFQAAVAIYYIGRRLNLGAGAIVQSLLKSAVVTAITAAATASCASLIGIGLVTPFVGLVSASCAAALGWWLGLTLTGHPLLRQLYHAAGGVVEIIGPRLRPRRSMP
jgi:O-antigen/teichoic acid export membrane protein